MVKKVHNVMNQTSFLSPVHRCKKNTCEEQNVIDIIVNNYPVAIHVYACVEWGSSLTSCQSVSKNMLKFFLNTWFMTVLQYMQPSSKST